MMELKLKTGFDKIKFGMIRREIIAILGNPDRVIPDEYDNDEKLLTWNKLKLTLTFNNEDRFTYFSSKNSKLIYQGQKIIDSEISFAKKTIFGDIVKEWEVEDYSSFETHFNEQQWLTLHSEYNRVSQIELGVPFTNDGNYEWPH